MVANLDRGLAMFWFLAILIGILAVIFLVGALKSPLYYV